MICEYHTDRKKAIDPLIRLLRVLQGKIYTFEELHNIAINLLLVEPSKCGIFKGPLKH